MNLQVSKKYPQQDGGWDSYAKKPIAPVGVKALVSLGKTTVRTAAKNRLIETARLMPTSDDGQQLQLQIRAIEDLPRWKRGKASAEYVKGTGSSPGE